jgi:hypothetical protein
MAESCVLAIVEISTPRLNVQMMKRNVSTESSIRLPAIDTPKPNTMTLATIRAAMNPMAA